MFPTRDWRFREYETLNVGASLAGKANAGHLQLYCVEGLAQENFCEAGRHPADHIRRHAAFEDDILNEVLPLMAWTHFHTPAHFLPGFTCAWRLEKLRQLDIVLAVGEADPFLDNNRHLSRLLDEKSVRQQLHIRDERAHHAGAWRESSLSASGHNAPNLAVPDEIASLGSGRSFVQPLPTFPECCVAGSRHFATSTSCRCKAGI